MLNEIIDGFFDERPALLVCKSSITQAFEILKGTYADKKKVMTCGNGGSASDAEHIVGELMKGFVLPRPYHSKILFGKKLQKALPAISLVSQTSLATAIANDNGADLVFAQQVLGYGNANDTLIALSTSGNSANVANAVKIARELGVNTIGFTGADGGALKDLCDVCIRVPFDETPKIQECHLPIYHLLCMLLEYHFFL